MDGREKNGPTQAQKTPEADNQKKSKMTKKREMHRYRYIQSNEKMNEREKEGGVLYSAPVCARKKEKIPRVYMCKLEKQKIGMSSRFGKVRLETREFSQSEEMK